MKKNVILAGMAIVVLLAVGYSAKKPGFKEFFSKEKEITAEEAKEKIAGLIKDNGGSAEVGSVSEESGLYKVMINFNGQEQSIYVTKDGTKFIQSAIDFEEIKKEKEEAQKKEEETYGAVSKSDKPEVDLYVMSFCPFGNKAEDTMKSVYDLLKDKVDFNFHYIVSSNGDEIQSLHGEKEVVQNEREACVLKNYGKGEWISFVSYVNANCGNDGACWEKGAEILSLETAKINDCVVSEGTELMKADEKISEEAGAKGSPTMTINGTQTKTVYKYGNAEAYKQAICEAFNEAPEECLKTLSANAETTQGGSCN